jgi:hypothetical protein
MREKAGSQFAVGSDPHAIAMLAERLRHGADKPYVPDPVFESENIGGLFSSSFGIGYELHPESALDSPSDFIRPDDFLHIPLVVIT